MPRILAVVILSVAVFAASYGVGRAADDAAPAAVGSPASRLPAGLEPSATEHLGAASPLPSLATVRQRRGRRAASAASVVRRRPAPPPVSAHAARPGSRLQTRPATAATAPIRDLRRLRMKPSP